ncbi:MAG: nucleoside hydrolase [Chloroflexota bacterium]|nr:nucleoside hydrolase [Chloroflexota bacterium]MDE2898763.1 nucleoside hydrolase [Chloroflexota bacterium]
MQRVVIDTDPGTDDALALLMALNSPDLRIEGITTVGGNATLAETTDNALRLVDHVGAGRDVPIAVGAERPARGSFSHAYHVHGADGLGVDLPAATSTAYSADAAKFMRDRALAEPGRIAVIALGPLTNVAAALDGRPDVAQAISEVCVMGGAVEVPGNVTPHAEFNIYEDPWSANAVFASGVPVTLIGLDVTRGTSLHRNGGPRWFQGTSRSADLGNHILANSFRERADVQEFFLHDPLAVAAAIEPELLTYRSAQIAVVTDGEERGRTVASYGDGPVKVALGVDAGRAVDVVRTLISN